MGRGFVELASVRSHPVQAVQPVPLEPEHNVFAVGRVRANVRSDRTVVVGKEQQVRSVRSHRGDVDGFVGTRAGVVADHDA